MKNTKTKKILAITLVTLGSVGFANAQTTTPINSQQNFGQKIMQNLTDAQKAVLQQAKELMQSGKKDEAKTLLEQNNLHPKHKMHKKNKHEQRETIHNAIISGNYVEFQKVASTSPLAKIDQNTFNSLTPHFTALKNARTNIDTILKNAGVERPNHK